MYVFAESLKDSPTRVINWVRTNYGNETPLAGMRLLALGWGSPVRVTLQVRCKGVRQYHIISHIMLPLSTQQ